METRRKTRLILPYIKIKNVQEKKTRKKEFEWIKEKFLQ